MNDLLDAIGEFTNPYRENDGSVPSLWDQVLAGVTRSGGAGGKPSSRPPVTSGQLSLVAEVERVCRTELSIAGDTVSHTRDGERDGERDIPDELRRIHHHLRPWPAQADRMAHEVRQWCAQARELLGLIPQRISLPRGTRCPACDQAWVDRVTDDGELVREPALVLLWSDDDRVERYACLACHHDAEASELHDVAEHQAHGARCGCARKVRGVALA